MRAHRRLLLPICTNAVALGFAAAAILAITCGANVARSAERVVLPVPSAPIAAGAVISDSDLVDKPVRPSAAAGSVLRERSAIVGKVARRVLLPGRPISLFWLKEVDLVVPGQPVALVYSSDGLTITGRAVPLQPGKQGEMIAVRNMDSGVVVRGIVDMDGSVRVSR